MTWKADRVVAAGIELARFSAGSADPAAPVVVMLHGWGHWTSGAWDRLVPEIDPSRRIVALDLPGFGASERPRARSDPRDFARVLDAFAAAELPERFALVGHSLGALLAAEFAARSPGRVAHLALLAPLGFARTPRLAARLAAAHLAQLVPALPVPEALLMRTLRAAVYDPQCIDRDVAARARALARDRTLVRAGAAVVAGLRGTFLRMRRAHARWSQYGGPVLIAFGHHDRFLPPAASVAAARRVYPHAHVLWCERSAHLPMVEEPALVGAALRALFAS
jgi:pimeloyl-ACP methyl ester carboxylesterase